MRVEAGKDEKENRQIIEYIKMKALETSRCKIYGKNILIRDLVQFFWETEAMEAEFFMLTTTDGLILAFFEVGRWEENMAGYRVSLDELRRFGQKVSFLKDIPGYATVVMGAEQVREKIQDIHGTIAGILQIFDQREQRNQYLLDCLDYVQNAISIFDKDVRLMYANKPYFDDYHIADRNAPIGMYIEDITQKYGLNFVSFEKISERYKMLEVIKKGKEAVDWEIRLEVASSDKPPRLVSNDMFPIKDERGKVEGLIEITHSRQQDVKRARKMVGLSAEYTFDQIIAVSLFMQEKIHMAKEYAKTPYSVLITGESGVGKELFAQSIHNYSDRRKGPFVAINCANFPESLIESELFGYVEGAFTGASKKGQMGKFELADHGTLFLDEIGELPYHFQSKLLRVLETMTVTRIGSSQQIPVDVRVVAATNRDLETMVLEGVFREDLYYRLQVLNIEIPPLRERKEDLLPLANALLSQAKDPAKVREKHLSREAEQALSAYDWPGNVRELRNVISRANILSLDDEISAKTMEQCIYPKKRQDTDRRVASEGRADLETLKGQYSQAYGRLLEELAGREGEEQTEIMAAEIKRTEQEFRRFQIQWILEYTGGNKKKAAQLLGVSRKTFYRMLEEPEG